MLPMKRQGWAVSSGQTLGSLRDKKHLGGDQRNLFLRYLYLAYNFYLLGKERFKRVSP